MFLAQQGSVVFTLEPDKELTPSDQQKLRDANANDDTVVVSGGTTANLVAAYDVLAGKYGEGQDRVNRLSAAGYNYNDVQSLVNALCKGYGPVATDVINGRYGNNAARRASLIRAGYDPDQVQNLVNNMVWG